MKKITKIALSAVMIIIISTKGFLRKMAILNLTEWVP